MVQSSPLQLLLLFLLPGNPPGLMQEKEQADQAVQELKLPVQFESILVTIMQVTWARLGVAGAG